MDFLFLFHEFDNHLLSEIINNQLGTYKIHDVVEIENNDSSSIIIFPEDFQGIETPTFISTDKCENISSFDILNDFQGRDIYVIDLNNDGLARFVHVCGNRGFRINYTT